MAFVDGASSSSSSFNAVPGQKGDTWGIGGKQVKDVIEGLVRRIWKEVKDEDVQFEVMPYEVAMDVVRCCASVTPKADWGLVFGR